MKLNEAVSERLQQLLAERGMTQYQLYMKSGVPKSTIGNIVNCQYDSMKLRILHELCQGLQINLTEFFDSSLFDEENLEPLISGAVCAGDFLYPFYVNDFCNPGADPVHTPHPSHQTTGLVQKVLTHR